MDLMKGYHQVKMEDKSKNKTAFICHLGLFQYRCMPFGLNNAQQPSKDYIINKLFYKKEWDSVFTYLDDILVVSATFKENLHDVGHVLDYLGEAGLRLKPAKCVKQSEILRFHTISSRGATKQQGQGNFGISKTNT